ncbi:MAG: beta-hydroxyacyl-ACP dehydratase [Planctomycetota bacterium]
MPPTVLYDLSDLDLDRQLDDIPAIEDINPQRGDMLHVNGICHVADDGAIGFKDIRDDEFWVPGHIPGRPLLPGVIMLEAAAQVASYYTKVGLGWEGFIGFGGIENCKFRKEVLPGGRMYILVKLIEQRHRRVRCNAQGLVNGSVVFEADIIGTKMG